MPTAHICMIKNYISPQIATDYGKRLIQQPQAARACVLVLNSKLERILNSTGS